MNKKMSVKRVRRNGYGEQMIQDEEDGSWYISDKWLPEVSDPEPDEKDYNVKSSREPVYASQEHMHNCLWCQAMLERDWQRVRCKKIFPLHMQGEGFRWCAKLADAKKDMKKCPIAFVNRASGVDLKYPRWNPETGIDPESGVSALTLFGNWWGYDIKDIAACAMLSSSSSIVQSQAEASTIQSQVEATLIQSQTQATLKDESESFDPTQTQEDSL